MRRCKCGADTPMGRANRYGVRMPMTWCGSCDRPEAERYAGQYGGRYRSPFIVGPASCLACGGCVWYDRVGAAWVDGDRHAHRCAARKAA